MVAPFIPDEVFAKILPHLHPDDILKSIAPACRRLYLLANDPLLWKWICEHHFKAFSSEHKFGDLLKRPALEVDWLALYRLRKQRDSHALQLLDDMTKSPMLQLDKLDALCEFDYDVKELLIEQTQLDPYQGNGFSRAFWARKVLDSIHRRRGVGVWMEMRDPARGPEGFCRPSPENEARGHERGHAAFDMFVLHESWCDVDWISAQLDSMAESFRSTVTDFEARSTRSKALLLNTWLRGMGFAGLQDHGNYRYLRNCLVGQALRSPDHQTIPITSATIYCAIAKRLDILADPCFNPGHVIVCVRPSLGETLDGEETQPGKPTVPMYLDPWGRGEEVPIEDLSHSAVPTVWESRSRQGLTHPVETVQRVHNNIHATTDAAERRYLDFLANYGELSSGHGQLNLIAAQYANSWVQMILGDPQEGADDHVSKLATMLVFDFPEDVKWAGRFLGPMLQSNPELFPPQMDTTLEDIVTNARRRCEEDFDANEWPWDCEVALGKVFRHERHDFIGVICRAKVQENLSSDDTPHYFECQFAERPGQDFVVAQKSISIVTDATLVSPEMFPQAGQYFKRFDKEQCRFIPIPIQSSD